MGIAVSNYLSGYDGCFGFFTQKTATPKNANAREMSKRLFTEMSLSDVYKNDKVLEIIRAPGSVSLCKRCTTGKILDVGGFQFSERGDVLAPNDAAIVSNCFRSMNALEVGLGYPCTFDPKFLIRFKSKSGSDTVDFLCGKDCHLIDWYLNGQPVMGSVSRMKLSAIGISIIESICRVKQATEENSFRGGVAETGTPRLKPAPCRCEGNHDVPASKAPAPQEPRRAPGLVDP